VKEHKICEKCNYNTLRRFMMFSIHLYTQWTV